MTSNFDDLLAGLRAERKDTRFHVFDVTLTSQNNRPSLAGRVLEESDRQALRAALGADLDDSQLVVLRAAGKTQLRTAATNLTSLKAGPSWQAEELDQLLAGQSIEVLETQGNWGFVRKSDGYLGWAYLPYTTSARALPPTHITLAPLGLLRSAPDGDLVGRVMAGTYVTVLEERSGWARVAVFEQDDPACPAQLRGGWYPGGYLRGLDAMPAGAAARQRMLQDAQTFLGAPYLWGGCAVGGVDCSGLAQLLHRLVGITTPRDADDQYRAGRPVQAPDFTPGDLIFYGEDGHITHVSVCTGGWNIIHSSRRRNGVYYDDVQAVDGLRTTYMCAATYLEM